MICLNDAGDIHLLPAAATPPTQASAIADSYRAIIGLYVQAGHSVTLGILNGDTRLREVFPNGLVPLVSVVPSAVVIATEDGTTSRPGYLVPKSELSMAQGRALAAALAGERDTDFDSLWLCVWAMDALPIPRRAIAMAIVKQGGGRPGRPAQSAEGNA